MAADAASRGMGRWCVLVAMVSGCLLVKMSLQPDGHADEPMPAAAPSEAATAVSRPPPASSEALATLASSGPAIQPERSTASELLVSPETVPRDTRRHKMALDPFAWRQHRKKMTELTVTSPCPHPSPARRTRTFIAHARPHLAGHNKLKVCLCRSKQHAIGGALGRCDTAGEHGRAGGEADELRDAVAG